MLFRRKSAEVSLTQSCHIAHRHWADNVIRYIWQRRIRNSKIFVTPRKASKSAGKLLFIPSTPTWTGHRVNSTETYKEHEQRTYAEIKTSKSADELLLGPSTSVSPRNCVKSTETYQEHKKYICAEIKTSNSDGKSLFWPTMPIWPCDSFNFGRDVPEA